MSETIQDYLKRGGKITQCKNGGRTTVTGSLLVRKDAQIAEMKKLLCFVDGSLDKELKVRAAINLRTQILKGT